MSVAGRDDLRPPGASAPRRWLLVAAALLLIAVVATSAVVTVGDRPDAAGDAANHTAGNGDGAGGSASDQAPGPATPATGPGAANGPGDGPRAVGGAGDGAGAGPPAGPGHLHADTVDPEAHRWPPGATWIATTGPLAVEAAPAGRLDVVGVGELDGSGTRLAAVVHNATSRTAYDVEVRAEARGADGRVLATGRAQLARPRRIAPGEWAVATVVFERPVPAPFEFAFTVADRAEPRSHSVVDLAVVGLERTLGGTVDLVVARVRNVAGLTVDGAVLSTVVCFDDTGPGWAGTTFHTVGELAPTETAAIEVLVPSCPEVAVAATAWAR